MASANPPEGEKWLNLGAGNRVLGSGWINHDLFKHRAEIDVAWDLDEVPWPWSPNSIDHISAISVFEHLKLALIETLDECWRILKPGCTLYMKFPMVSSPFIYHDPTHRWRWSSKVVDFVDPTTVYGRQYGYYTDRKWRIVKRTKSRRNCWVSLETLK